MAHLRVTTEKIVCKVCGSSRVVGHGTYKDKRRWLCRDCGKAWTDNRAAEEGKLPAEYVAYALSSYYDGVSQHRILENLRSRYENSPSSATVHYWINKYTNKAIDTTKSLKPKVGGVWIADESWVRVDQRKSEVDQEVENPYEKGRKGKWVVFWDIIDADTRFLLASLVTTTRGIEDAKRLMELAAERAGKMPRVVVTDKLKAYIGGIEQAYGADTKHKRGSPFDIENNTNLIERFHGSLKARTKVMRGLRNLESTKFFTDGWLAYYNFLRLHMAIGKTPAQAASIRCPFNSWDELIGVRELPVVCVETIKEKPKLIAAKRSVRHRAVRKRARPESTGIYMQGVRS